MALEVRKPATLPNDQVRVNPMVVMFVVRSLFYRKAEVHPRACCFASGRRAVMRDFAERNVMEYRPE